MSRFAGKSRGANSKTSGSGPLGSFNASSFSTTAAFGVGGRNRLSYLFEPPDLSTISDPNVVVSLKNVLKKDATTKARALDDLTTYVRAHPFEQDGGVEDTILDAWVEVYSRTSIDNSRRVRELSHTLLLELMRSAKKRMEKRIPQVVGPWLAGTYDRDRGVSRTASDGLRSFLNTDEKVLQFWKRCQPQILGYAAEAAQETPDTLSDERSTNKDDSLAKYHRVLGGSLSLVLGLLQRMDAADTSKCGDDYDKFFSLEIVWAAATATDPFVRRQCYQLLWVSLDTQAELLQRHTPRIARILVSEALKSNQTGSALELVKVLTKLTKKHPEIWGTKKPPLSRLRPFLEKGSQASASAASFWVALGQLLRVMPQDTISFEAAADLLKSVRAGASHRDEPRASAVDAWTLFLSVVRRLLSIVDPPDARLKLVTEFVHPLAEHYVQLSSDKAPFGAAAQLEVATKAALLLSEGSDQALVESTQGMWSNLADHLVGRLSSSLSEAPEDYDKAQQSIADEGTRFFSLIGAIHGEMVSSPPAAGSEQAFRLAELAAEKTLDSALGVLSRGIYRPFGAAAVLESAFTRCPFHFKEERSHVVEGLFPVGSQTQMETLLSSASAPHMLASLAALDGIPQHTGHFKSTWGAVIRSLLEHPDTITSTKYITKMLAHVSAGPLSHDQPRLQQYLLNVCLGCIRGATANWELFETCFTFDALTLDVSKQVVREIMDALHDANIQNCSHALKALGIVAHRQSTLLSEDNNVHMALATRLLALTEISDQTISNQATTLRLILEKQTDGLPPVVGIIQENLETAGAASLEVDTLVQQALKISDSSGVSPEDLFPSTTIWAEDLSSFFKDGLNPSLSLTSNLAGAYFLSSVNSMWPDKEEPRRDRKGLSVPARMALYTTKLLSSGFRIVSLPPEFQVELLSLLYLVSVAASDQIALMEEERLWKTLERPEVLSDAEELVSSTRKIIRNVVATSDGWKDGPGSDTSITGKLLQLLLDQSRTLSPSAVYSAAALSDLIGVLVEKYGFRPGHEEWIAKLDVMKATPSTVLPCVAILNGYGELLASSRVVNTLLNRLVSDVAGAPVGSPRSLLTLVLLNACMKIYGFGELPVASNRVVFAVRQITSWFDAPKEVGSKFAAESCWALQCLLPCIKDIYGPFWEKALDFSLHLWERAAQDLEDRRLPYVDASLRLVSALEKIEEPNDDLSDAMQSIAQAKTGALIELLELQQEGTSQPAEIVNAQLCRQIERVPLEHVTDLGDIYGLIASRSRDVQTAAFSLLRRAVSRMQERLSVDILLEKTNVQLPDELLSLLLDPPTVDSYPEDILVEYPTPVRGYLLAWLIIFEAFAAASPQLRNEYTENLKTTASLGPLLDFTFDVLGHSAARPLSLDRVRFDANSITTFSVKLADSEPEERSMQWLLIHLYYLSLKHLPGLVKLWYINCRSKQTRIAVEAWTTKYFSSIIVSETLDDVSKWASEQEPPAEDEKELLIKVSKPSREVIAGYEVDELHASIAIRIPANYPLDGVSVVGINRVAVNERKWQSWLMTTQGVITFSNGSIVDGLAAFRRNVVGALKGQTECAICYSIISTDKKLPDKRCGTCRNLFHRSCLYQWFQTSNQNTCPLCRNPIDYLGAPARRGPVDPYDA